MKSTQKLTTKTFNKLFNSLIRINLSIKKSLSISSNFKKIAGDLLEDLKKTPTAATVNGVVNHYVFLIMKTTNYTINKLISI